MTGELTLRVAAREDLEFLFSLLRVSLGPYVEQTFGPWQDEEQRARDLLPNFGPLAVSLLRGYATKLNALLTRHRQEIRELLAEEDES
jgi:hypothetical protein